MQYTAVMEPAGSAMSQLGMQENAVEDKLEASSSRLVGAQIFPTPASSTAVVASGCHMSGALHGLPIAHEVRHALQRLLDSGVETTIDVSGLPLPPSDEAMLRELLGTGEVRAELSVIGRSTICETAISGVWWIEHYGSEGEFLGRYIEIAPVPAILRAQPQDMRDSLTALTAHLSNAQEEMPTTDD